MTVFDLHRPLIAAVYLSVLLAACSGESPEAMLASARGYLSKGDPKAAIIQIKNALQKNPEMAEARFLLGKTLLDGGDPVNAEIELRKALALKHPFAQTAPLLAKAMLAQGQAKKIVEEFKTSEGLPPEGVAELQTHLAGAFWILGKPDEADKALAVALGAKADHAPALLFQARVKAVRGDRDGAIAVVEGLIAKSPSNSDGHKLHGDLLSAHGDKSNAEAAYRKAIEVKPDNLGAYSSLIELLVTQGKIEGAGSVVEQMKKVSPKSLATLYQETRLSFVRKDLPKAREQVQQILKQSPDNLPGLHLAGSIEYVAGAYPQAELHFNKLVRLAPDNLTARRLLAMTQLRLGQPARAVQSIDPVLGKIEGNPSMLSLAGEVMMQNGEVSRAEHYFRKAAALEPTNIGARTSLALAHLAQGDQAALSELEGIAATDSGTRADMAIIASAIRRGQFDQALKALASLEKKQPKSPMPHHIRGGVLLGKKDIAGARKSLERALALNPAYFPSAMALAGLDMAEMKPNDATKRFEAVLAADPKSVQSYLALAELKTAAGAAPNDVLALLSKAVSENPLDASSRVALVNFHMRTKDVKKAMAAAQEASATIVDRPEILDVLGRVQLAAGDPNQALATFSKMAALTPNSPVPNMRSAEVLLASKDVDGAIKSLRKSLEIQPNYLDAQRALIGLHLGAGASDQAMKIARDVQKQRPKDPIGPMFEGDVRAASKSWKDAAAAYRSALKLGQVPDIAVRLHTALLLGDNVAEAQRFAASWEKDNPKDPVFRFYLADLALRQQDLATAAVRYREVTEIQPTNALALNNLAWIAGQQKNPKALEYAERANRLVPNNPPYMDTLAMILLENGEHKKAVDLLKTAAGLAPGAYAIRLNLARAMIRAGDKDGARKELDALAQLGDKGPKKVEIDQVRNAL